MSRFARTDTSVIARWWRSVDFWSLIALGLLIGVGVVLTLAASPAVAERIGRDSFHFAWRQLVFIPPALVSLYPRSLDWVQPGLGFDNTYPINLALPIMVVWAIIGVAFYLWLRTVRPQQLDIMANEMARVELVGEEDDPNSRAVIGRSAGRLLRKCSVAPRPW